MDLLQHLKFNSILNDSLSLVKLLDSSRFDKNCFLFTIDFKSLYTNIPVNDALNSIRKLCFDYQNVIPNAHFIIELLDLVLNSSLMVFDGEYFQQIFGLIMGTNVAPILTNIYMAMHRWFLATQKIDTVVRENLSINFGSDISVALASQRKIPQHVATKGHKDTPP
jgi:hypothetical protein